MVVINQLTSGIKCGGYPKKEKKNTLWQIITQLGMCNAMFFMKGGLKPCTGEDLDYLFPIQSALANLPEHSAMLSSHSTGTGNHLVTMKNQLKVVPGWWFLATPS